MYILEGAEIIDAVMIDGLDSHHISVNQPLSSAGYPPSG